MFILKKQATQKVCNSTAIIGSARSGTTIVGKIVGSFEKIEYFFEPELLFSLFANKDQISENFFKQLYETYLYEDLFVNAVTGRKLNLRKIDDSSIFFTHSSEEVENRLHIDHLKERFISENNICYKIPDFTHMFSEVTSMYPKMRTIQVIRDPISTINSIMEKGWFSDHSLQKANIIWPLDLSCKIPKPHWASKITPTDWNNYSELDRCCYYYESQTIQLQDCNNLLVKYDDLLQDPFSVTKKMAKHIGAKPSNLTKDILQSVKMQSSTNHTPNRYMSSNMIEKLVQLYESQI